MGGGAGAAAAAGDDSDASSGRPLDARRADHRSLLRVDRPHPVAGPAVHAVPARPPGHPRTPRCHGHPVPRRRPRPGRRYLLRAERLPGGELRSRARLLCPGTSFPCGPARSPGTRLGHGRPRRADSRSGAARIRQPSVGTRHRRGLPSSLRSIGLHPGRSAVQAGLGLLGPVDFDTCPEFYRGVVSSTPLHNLAGSA
jgi:hypothetical protein